jgi:hypothetical protein
MIKKLLFALVLGIIGTIFFAEYDSWTHQKIEHIFQEVAQKYLGGHFSCSVQSVSFFAPSLVLHDLEMRSIDSCDWSWRCKKCELHCSWIQLLLKGMMDQHVTIDGFECTSRVEKSRFAIEQYIIAMMQKSFLPFPVELKSIVFKNAHFCAYDDLYNIDCALSFNSSSLRVGNQIKTTLFVGDGQVAYKKDNYVEKIATDIFLMTEFCDKDGTYDISAQIAGTCALSQMGDQGGCYVTGSWKGDRGRFSIRNAYNSVMIDPIVITEKELRINTQFPLSYVAHCIVGSSCDQMINGTLQCFVKMSKDEEQKIDGQLVIENMKLSDYYICDVGKVGFSCHGDDWKIRLGMSRYNQECKGTGFWNQATHKGEFNIKNSTDLSSKLFSYWRIKPHSFNAHIAIDNDTITGFYDAITTHTLSNAMHMSNSSFSYAQGLINTQGCIDENHFSVAWSIYPQFAVHHCSYSDKENKQLLTLLRSSYAKASEDTQGCEGQADENKLTGSIAFPFIRSVINSTMKYDVQGEGNLDVVATISPTEIIADVALNEATIRLPQTYNFIDGFKSHFVYNIAQRSAVLEDINLSLYSGKVNCLCAHFNFDTKGALIFAHAPCIFNECLLNIKKDLFATVSGTLLFSKSLQSDARIDGHILIDKSQLKENLFSGIIQKQLLSYTQAAFATPDMPLGYNLIIETKLPIVVDTGFLQTNAHVAMQISNDMQENTVMHKSLSDGWVTGTVTLHAGTINFPYKPLYISKGVITFYPDQLFDPAIELFARNKIKKYDVSLHVDGSLLNHHIILDATPGLTEEQIVGLLLVGAEENSLNSMMPALIVQNLKSLILSNNQLSFFDKYFKPLLGSFNINLVPSFTDQTGRGGLRGALEITVDDRWRAVIQKNFSLTEDTKFELEFLLSDDITLRAIRDERRDLGGEVEMRWKF